MQLVQLKVALCQALFGQASTLLLINSTLSQEEIRSLQEGLRIDNEILSLEALTEGSPIWASAMQSKGQILSVLGNALGDQSYTRSSIQSLESSLDYFSGTTYFASWAQTKLMLANTYLDLHQTSGSQDEIRKAVEHARDIYDVTSDKGMVQIRDLAAISVLGLWRNSSDIVDEKFGSDELISLLTALLKADLPVIRQHPARMGIIHWVKGSIRLRQGNRNADVARYEDARSEFEAAVTMLDNPWNEDWCEAINGLGVANFEIGNLRKNVEFLHKSIASHTSILSERRCENLMFRDVVRYNLATSYIRLGEVGGDRDASALGVSLFRELDAEDVQNRSQKIWGLAREKIAQQVEVTK